ncbi:MAG: hypothetical protein JO204_12025 [Alphaproteobacteria bacterium]|nr:hypothetical protein [Alphaproteobacteria bacterium]
MSPSAHYVRAKRQEPELRHLWGLYSPREDRWLDVVFASANQAEEAIMIISTRMSKDKKP